MAFKWFKKKKREQQDDSLQEPTGDEILPETQSDEIGHPEPGADSVLLEKPLKPDDLFVDDEIKSSTEDPVGSSDEETLPRVDESEGEQRVGEPAEKYSTGFFARLKKGLTKTRNILNTNIEDLFVSSKGIDDTTLEDLEEMLITSDIGVQTSIEIIKRIAKQSSKIHSSKELKDALKTEFLALLPESIAYNQETTTQPHIVMVVGVNGVGKTTTIGKLAAKLTSEKKKGLVVAADTFRAAAVEQLTIWAKRSNMDIIKHKEGADPAAVAFDGVSAGVARNADTVYIDTAGRLHTKTNLMEELKKIKRSIAKKLPGAPHEILLVIDATTGQNALSQAKLFNEALDLTGLILTKLDGTAKGGIVLSICNTLDIPLKYVGVGESIEDLQVFDPLEFVNALL